jgi:hypothetical protein
LNPPPFSGRSIKSLQCRRPAKSGSSNSVPSFLGSGRSCSESDSVHPFSGGCSPTNHLYERLLDLSEGQHSNDLLLIANSYSSSCPCATLVAARTSIRQPTSAACHITLCTAPSQKFTARVNQYHVVAATTFRERHRETLRVMAWKSMVAGVTMFVRLCFSVGTWQPHSLLAEW